MSLRSVSTRPPSGSSTPPARCCSTPTTPRSILARTAEPILTPETEGERAGTVPNVVFPTAVEEVDGVRFVFYGMADSRIGVARLDHS